LALLEREADEKGQKLNEIAPELFCAMASGIKRKRADNVSDSQSCEGLDTDSQTSPECQSVSNMLKSGSSVPRRWEPSPHLDAYFRNLYTSEPDFKLLAVQDPDFAT